MSQRTAPEARTAFLEVHRARGWEEVGIPPQGLSIGRADDNDLVLDDPKVSRRHARLDWMGQGVGVIDLGSANGTRVNGAAIAARAPVALREGDSLSVGDVALRVRMGPAEAPVARDATRIEAEPPGVRPEPAAAAGPRLVVTADGRSQAFPLDRDVLVIGRDPSCDIHVDHDAVSRHHAEIRREGGEYTIIDLNSTNGLTVHGERVPRKQLQPGDVVHISSRVALTYDDGRPASAATAPPPARRPGAAVRPERRRAGAPTHLDLAGRSTVGIGRDPQNDIPLDHPTVSRFHARIVAAGEGRHQIQDLGSTNGTFLNGQRIPQGVQWAMAPGDTVRVGPAELVYTGQALQARDESRGIKMDVFHLNKWVSRELNLLKDISFSIEPREFVAVVGVSGAGKSTLLDALNGFRPATEGAVLVNGSNLYENLDAYRTELGYVPQDDIIHKELSPYQALDFAARLRLPADTSPTERHQRVTEVLEMLGILERKDLPIQRLSGGQRKRVSIGVELLTRPGLFFLDEATSGLDPGTESLMMKLLRDLAGRGHTIVLITHATKNVMLCDQVVFLAKGGNLAYYGPPEEALEYFETEDFDAIYLKLDEQGTPEEWAERYRRSPQHAKYVVERLREAAVQAPSTAPAAPVGLAPGAKVKRVSALGQLGILSRRNLAILARDRFSMLLMLSIAPAIGLMDLITWKKQFFTDPAQVGQARTFLFLAMLVSVLVGAVASMREIVKEAEIYRRERMVTLRIAPYILSKIWLGVVLALYQAAVFVMTKKLATGFAWPPGAGGLVKTFITLFLATLSGMLLGLFISAISSNQNVTPLLLIVFLVPQFMFGNPDLNIGKAGDVIGAITTTKWGYEALLTISGFSKGSLTQRWGLLLIICGVVFAGLLAAQKSKDSGPGGLRDRLSGLLGRGKG